MSPAVVELISLSNLESQPVVRCPSPRATSGGVVLDGPGTSATATVSVVAFRRAACRCALVNSRRTVSVFDPQHIIRGALYHRRALHCDNPAFIQPGVADMNRPHVWRECRRSATMCAEIADDMSAQGAGTSLGGSSGSHPVRSVAC